MSSWFSDIAGKAETFLNRMDQTAAAALHGSTSPHQVTDVNEDSPAAIIPTLVTYQPRYTPTPLPTTVTAGHSRNSSLGSSFSTISSRDVYSSNGGHSIQASIPSHLHNHSIAPPSMQKASLKSNLVDDEKLVEYLNSPSSSSTPVTRPKGEKNSKNGLKRIPSSRKISSEEQSIASIEVVSVGSSEDGRTSKQDDIDDEEISEGGADEALNVKSFHDQSPLVSSGHTDDGTVHGDSFSLPSVSMNDVSQSTSREYLDSNDVNHLKETITSLEKEISTLNRRCIESETEVKRLNRRLQNWQTQVNSSDSALRELQSRELDLKAANDAKDQAISVLKVRLQECDNDLKAKARCMDDLRREYDLLLREKHEASSNLNQDIESLSKRLRELESELCQEKENSNTAQVESLNQMATLENNNRVLLDEMSALQRDLRSEKTKRKEVERQLAQIKTSHEAILSEFEEYKVKANNILQSKENLIKALQRKSNEGDEGIADTNDFQIDFEESNKQTLILQNQCDQLVNEVQELRGKNESLKEELKRVKEHEVRDVEFKLSTLNEELDEVRRHKTDLEEEHRHLQDEMRQMRDDFERTKCSLQERISDRDKEVDKLRKQLVAKRSASSNENSVQELQMRIQSLTDNLLQKQTVIEQLSSEKQSLGLQLERSEARFRTVMDEMSLGNGARSPLPGSVAIGMVNSMSASTLVNRGGYRPLTESPYDGEVTKRVKRVYSQFDSLSIRMGQFLRVYPAARGFFLLYILVLHIWVFLILFYYRPEVHDAEP